MAKHLVKYHRIVFHILSLVVQFYIFFNEIVKAAIDTKREKICTSIIRTLNYHKAFCLKNHCLNVTQLIPTIYLLLLS